MRQLPLNSSPSNSMGLRLVGQSASPHVVWCAPHQRAHVLLALARPPSRPATAKSGSTLGRSSSGASGQPSKSDAWGQVCSASCCTGLRATGCWDRLYSIS